MLHVTGDSTGNGAANVIIAAQEFRAHRLPETALRLLSMARGWYSAHPVLHASRPRAFFEGVAMQMTGVSDSAALRFAQLTADTTRLEAAGYLGIAIATHGDRTRARAIADPLGALRRPWLFGANTFWRAAI